MNTDYLRLYLVLETDMLKCPLEEFIPAVVEGGVTCIQLRDKGHTVKEHYDLGRKIQKLLEGKDVLFVINDRVDLAAALDAEAVHLGIKDLPLGKAKEKFTEFTYGYSCNDMADIETAKLADYIGVGPTFATSTKKDLRGVIGPEGIKRLVASTEKPAVAIGGIGERNISELKGIGLSGVAVSSAICASENPYEAAKLLRAQAEEL